MKSGTLLLATAGYIVVSFADITKRGIDTAGDDEPGKCAALISMQPITDEDRLAALCRSSCHDEVVGSPAISSSHHVVPVDQHAGEPRPCTSIGKLRRNIAEMRKQFDAPRARSDIPLPFPTDGLSPSSEGGGPNSSLQKSKRCKKKRSPIPHIQRRCFCYFAIYE